MRRMMVLIAIFNSQYGNFTHASGLVMRSIFLMVIAFCSVATVNADGAYLISHEQWARPKRVETVLQMPAIKNVLADFTKSPTSQLLILYPGGDEGTLWAHDIKAWLVSLGVSSRQIELRPGSGESAAIELQVESPLFGMIK